MDATVVIAIIAISILVIWGFDTYKSYREKKLRRMGYTPFCNIYGMKIEWSKKK